MPLVQPDQIDQIAMFAGCRIDPIANGPAFRLEQADIKAATGRARHIADHPITTFAPP